MRHQSKLNSNAETTSKVVRLSIHDMTHDGRGVAKLDGKTVFVTGALTDEVVDAQIVHQKSLLLNLHNIALCLLVPISLFVAAVSYSTYPSIIKWLLNKIN
ncbi:MAG TPA: TRAM domain-containing protein [Thiotrichales bacterium]|nr:TRAM domain-containing protein [Thiotrichales bacterium]